MIKTIILCCHLGNQVLDGYSRAAIGVGPISGGNVHRCRGAVLSHSAKTGTLKRHLVSELKLG